MVAGFAAAGHGCAGCVKAGAYACTSDTDCTLAGQAGRCEPVGFCSFPDPSCPSGNRFGAQSGPQSNACADDQLHDDAGGVPSVISLGGTVSGLAGTGLVLRNNGVDDLPITTTGPFTFPSPLTTGDPYAVTVGSQPSNPAQTCGLANASGVAGSTDITDVGVTCSTTAYTVGGTVAGLVGAGLVLTDNGGDDKQISANGGFTFATAVPSGGPFLVAIKTQPSGQTCNVSGGSGTVGTGNISNVVINCAAGTFTIGGTVNGLVGSVVLHNGSDTLTLNANGSFAFPTPIATGGMYAVTVTTQPAYPPKSQTCVVGAGAGTVGGANVTSVTVNCSTNTFTVGGTVSGLSGTLVLQDNGGDDLSVTTGTFAFATRIASGGTYSVTIKTQPSGLSCVITNGGTGTVANGNITSVTIACSAGSDPGILCGGDHCDPASQVCCVTNGVPACSATCAGAGTTTIACDDHQDCVAAGTPLLICCGSVSGTTVNAIYCTKPAQCTAPKAYFCDPLVATPCPDGGTCTATSVPAGYFRCY